MRSWTSCSRFSGSALSIWSSMVVEPLLDRFRRALAAPLRLVRLECFEVLPHGSALRCDPRPGPPCARPTWLPFVSVSLRPVCQCDLQIAKQSRPIGAMNDVELAFYESHNRPSVERVRARGGVAATVGRRGGPAPRPRSDRRRGRRRSSASSAARRTTSSWRCTRSCGPSTARTSRPGSTSSGCRPRRRGCSSARARTPGVVDVGDGIAAAIRIESHNHPSAIEPYQGAATGVGGILRDIFTMGARPIALMDPLRFGPLDDARSRWIAEGVVSGHLRLRQLGRRADRRRRGRVRRDLRRATRSSTCCASACCRPSASCSARPSGVGNLAVLLGSSTGPRRHRRRERAGLGRASATTSRRRQAPERAGRRPVRGEAADRGLPRRCSTPAWSSASRTSAAPASPAPPARRRRGAAWAWTSTSPPCPLREPGMEPFEVMTSESQERMLAIVEPDDLDEVLAICERWEVRAIGRRHGSTDGRPRCASSTAATARCSPTCPPSSLHEDAPLYDRPLRRRADLDASTPTRRRRIPAPDDCGADLLGLLADTVVGVVAVRPPAVPQHRRGPRRRRHRAAAQAPDHRRRHRPGPRAHHRRQPPLVRRRPARRARPWSSPSRC